MLPSHEKDKEEEGHRILHPALLVTGEEQQNGGREPHPAIWALTPSTAHRYISVAYRWLDMCLL